MNRAVDITDGDIQEAVDDLGIVLDEVNFKCLRDGVRDMDESDLTEFDRDFDDNSLFSDVCFDDLVESTSQPLRSIANVDAQCHSPLRVKHVRENRSERENYIQTLDLSFSDSEDDAIRALDPEGYRMIIDANDLICQMYEEFNAIDSEIQSARETLNSGLGPDRWEQRDNVENESPNAVEVDDKEAGSSSKSVHSSSSQTVPAARPTVARSHSDPNPSLRPVLCPAPGQAPFRHDSVTMYQIYKEEWKRRPTPEEQKRLALRWKVREYMMRRDIPRKHPTGAPAEHPKDWSPRPYLD